MMDIPGFRNALLTGMGRRIREADDRLAAYAAAMSRTSIRGQEAGPRHRDVIA